MTNLTFSSDLIIAFRDFVVKRHDFLEEKKKQLKGWFTPPDKGGIHRYAGRFVMSFTTSDIALLEMLRSLPGSNITQVKKSIYVMYRWRLFRKSVLRQFLASVIPLLGGHELAEWYQFVVDHIDDLQAERDSQPPLLRLPQRPSPFALWRIKNGLSQTKAAELMGCQKYSVLNLEQAISKVGPSWNARLAEFTGDPDMGTRMRQWAAGGRSLIPPPHHVVFDEIIPNCEEKQDIPIHEDRLRAIHYGAMPRREEIAIIARAIGWKPEVLAKLFPQNTCQPSAE